jgi:hypothetical protein
MAAPPAGTTKIGPGSEPGVIVGNWKEKAEQRMQDYLELTEKYVIPLAKHGDTLHRLTLPQKALGKGWVPDVEALVKETKATFGKKGE